MAKIKVGELRELGKQTEDIIEVSYGEVNLEIKRYLPILDKVGLISSIVEGCIDRENGLFIVRHEIKDMAYKIAIVEKYTNLTLPKDDIEAFDLINKSGIINTVMDTIPESELQILSKLLQDRINEERERYNQGNNIENIIKDGVNSIMFTIEDFIGGSSAKDLIKDVKGALNDIDPEKLSILQEFARINGADK